MFVGAGHGANGITVVIGDNVTSIPDWMFYTYSPSSTNLYPNIKSVIIGNNVTSIGKEAFRNCESLTTVTIGNSVTTIGYSAFQNCTSLATVTFGNSVESIGSNAFMGTRLTSLDLPASLNNVGGGLDGCSYLESITVDENNTTYHSAGNCLIKTATGMLVIGCKNSVIPNDGSVTSIRAYAFQNCTITSVAIPDSVTSLLANTFTNCTKLTTISIGSGLTSFAQKTFVDCAALTSITVDVNNTHYSSAGNCLIEISTGKLLKGFSTSVIPTDGSVTVICGYAFQACSSLTNLVIPEGVTNIEAYAFKDCTALTSLSLPSTLTSFNTLAVLGCNNLAGKSSSAKITFNGTKEQFSSIPVVGSCSDYDYVNASRTFYVQCSNGITSFRWQYTGGY